MVISTHHTNATSGPRRSRSDRIAHGRPSRRAKRTGDTHDCELETLAARARHAEAAAAARPEPGRTTTRRWSSRSITTPASCATAASAAATTSATTRSSAARARATRPASPSTSTRRWATPTAWRAASAWCRARPGALVNRRFGALDPWEKNKKPAPGLSGSRNLVQSTVRRRLPSRSCIGTRGRWCGLHFKKGDIICCRLPEPMVSLWPRQGHASWTDRAARSPASHATNG